MTINNAAEVATEVLLTAIPQYEDLLMAEDAWLLEGDFYQLFGDALFIGMPWHESTKLELCLLNKVPPLLCSLTILCLSQPSLTRTEIHTLLLQQISSIARSLNE
ncbi:hypothetical protein [Vibrio sp. DNB22_19_2]